MAGGIEWFRWHHGSVTDPKFKLVAHKAGVSLPDVLAVWAFVLEKASASEDRGSTGALDAASIDCLFGFEDGTTASIFAHMAARKLLVDGSVIAWEQHQPKRERTDDNSSERVRAHRAAKLQASNGAILDDGTPCNAKERQETPRGEESREEEIKKEQEKKDKNARSALSLLGDVDASVARDWIALRRSKKAPVTETAVAGIRKEAAKAGMPLEAALRLCCERGWTGFKSEWLIQKSADTWADRRDETLRVLTGAHRRAVITPILEIVDYVESSDARRVG